MKNKKLLFVGLSLLFGLMIYGLNYSLSQFSFAGMEVFDIKQESTEDKEDKEDDHLATAFSISIPNNVLFEDDFEGTTPKWTFTTSSNINKWHIGTAVNKSGTKSLYVSDDNGVSNKYSQGTSVIHAISPAITLDNTTTDYLFSFDWRAKAESNWDYLSLWLVLDTYTPQADISINVASGIGVEIARISGQENFVNVNQIKDLSAFKGKKIKLIFQWINDSYGYYNPAGAIDNFEFAKSTCKAPELKELKVSNIGLNTAKLDWKVIDPAIVNYDLYVGTSNILPKTQTNIITTTNVTTYNLSNLQPSTYYYVWYRSACAVGNESFWVGPLKFMTLCTPFNLPFDENFNEVSTTLGCWTSIDANVDGTSTGKNSWTIIKNVDTNNADAIYFDGEVKQHDDYFITPQFNLTGGIYKIEFDYKTASINETIDVLLSTTGKNIANFTTTIQANALPASSTYKKKTFVINGYTGTVTLAFRNKTNGLSKVYIDNFSITSSSCSVPSDVEVKNITNSSATIQWIDGLGSSWEYYVQELGFGLPATQGTTVGTKSAVITAETNGIPLTPSTEYEIYVRSVCADVTTNWEGPYPFKTLCNALNVPFDEGFNTQSTTFNCWKVLPNDVNNSWKQYNSSTYEGDRTMYIFPTQDLAESWLISPTFNLTAGAIYELSFYYRSNSTTSNAKLDVLLSNNGIDTSSFTTVLEPTMNVKTTSYLKKTIFIQANGGKTNLAWKGSLAKNESLYIDKVTLDKVDCINPLLSNISVINSQKNSVTIQWIDTDNTSWEYTVQATGIPAPVGTGPSINNSTVTITGTSGAQGGPLQPNTSYDFYVRSKCTAGKGKWIGPFTFKTPCAEFLPPFEEGFDIGSPSLMCWTTIANGVSKNNWIQSTTRFEGDRSYYYYGTNNDNWLMSPTITLDATKYYILKYYFRTSDYDATDFAVKLSKTGAIVNSFTTTLLDKKGYKVGDWKEEIIVISGTGGNVNFAWQVYSSNNSLFYIDKVSIEEVACPPATNLDVTNITKNSATISWLDAVNSNWEYIVQESGGNTPLATTQGKTTTSKSNTVTQDNTSKNLVPNTEYEFYVRAKCSTTSSSEWIGPFTFRTLCDVYQIPFWEGFNSDKQTSNCWTFLDNNKDGSGSSKQWLLNDYGAFEGDRMAYFYVYDYSKTIATDDWLISPTIVFAPGKIYRLKYHYKVSSYQDSNDFEVLASNNGTQLSSFTKTVVPMANYTNGSYIQQTAFISGFVGNVNIAWHTNGVGSKEIFIDNIFVEEVVGCPEPLEIGVDNLLAKSVDLTWSDDFGATDWEYYIVESNTANSSAPTATTTGTKTKSKITTATKDGLGNTLKPNTDYEYYVRTTCSNGQFSIWAGPFKFTTACDVYQAPFWEGFNTGNNSYRCWTILDDAGKEVQIGNGWYTTTSSFEGDQAWYLSRYKSNKTFDDWLISPMVELDGGQYVLKYHYKTSTNTNNINSFRVALSTAGTTPANFNTNLVPTKVYHVGNYVEEVVFINGIQGNVNIGWHVNGTNTNYSYLYLDNVTIKKVVTCPEPYYVKTTNATTTGFDVEWQQTGGVTSWEVIIVKKGDPVTATPVQVVQVTGTPKTTITGLVSGNSYSIYVRAKCNASTTSDWGTSIIGSVKVGSNNDCGQALVIPVSNGDNCEQSVQSTLFGATPSTIASPICNTNLVNDIWFEFTASSTIHSLNLDDFFSVSGANVPTIIGALYDVGCNAITGANAIECFNISTGTPFRVFSNLTVGQKYYVRFGTKDAVDISFKVCITSPRYIKVDEKYTDVELVKDVLVVSNCDLVSNVTSITGTNFGASNGIGYFTNTNPALAFDEGIILATNGVQYAPGPGGGATGYDSDYWAGDADLNKILLKNGQTRGSNNASVLEFDFIPIKDNLSFNFILASEEYGYFQCEYADVFAFILTDLTTGEQTNLAVVPNTDIPVAVTTIRDSKYKPTCSSENAEYFDKYYDDDVELKARYNPLNYKGFTKPLIAKSAVVPGRKYHIKLAIADYGDTSYDSAVLLEAGSFDLGNLDLGADLLVDTGNALCSGEPVTVKSGLSDDASLVEIKWYKDDVLIPGETKPDYVITESGTYKVTGTYLDINCPISGEIKAEIFPAIHMVVEQHKSVSVCRFTRDGSTVDLLADEKDMFIKSNQSDYKLVYYRDKDLTDLIDDPENYVIDAVNTTHNIYILIEDLRTGCSEVFTFKVVPETGDIPATPSNVLVCDRYELPSLAADQYYFDEPGGKGKEYKAGDVLLSGKYTMYVLQANGPDCFEETSFEIEVTEKKIARVFEDQILACDLYVLKELDEFSKYYIEVAGQRIEVASGTPITQTNTRIYVVAKSTDGVCEDESSFMIRYEECPIPKGVSPNGDGINDVFDLSKHGVTSLKIYNRNGSEVYSFEGLYAKEWFGQGKGNKPLPSGTYFYVIQSFDKTRTGWVELNY